MADNRTESAFTDAMLDIYRTAREELSYNSSRFRQMVVEHGGLDAARSLLHAPNPSEGYETLWERGRLDLSVEALVLQPEWRTLFTDEERKIARARLREFGYDPGPPDEATSSDPPSPSDVLVEGREYTRPDLYELLQVPAGKRRGDWETGYHRDEYGRCYVFASVGTPSRTGHDYPNEWRGNHLVWRGRTGSRLDQPLIQHMIADDTEVTCSRVRRIAIPSSTRDLPTLSASRARSP